MKRNDFGSGNWLHSRTAVITCLFLATIAFLMMTGHTAHLLGAVPYLLLLACPLMHLFMHGGHEHHHHGTDKQDASMPADEGNGEKTHKHSGGFH